MGDSLIFLRVCVPSTFRPNRPKRKPVGAGGSLVFACSMTSNVEQAVSRSVGQANMASSSATKMEAICSSEAPGLLRSTTQCYNPECLAVHNHRRRNVKSRIVPQVASSRFVNRLSLSWQQRLFFVVSHINLSLSIEEG
jgi:hypothetical protein